MPGMRWVSVESFYLSFRVALIATLSARLNHLHLFGRDGLPPRTDIRSAPEPTKEACNRNLGSLCQPRPTQPRVLYAPNTLGISSVLCVM